MLDPVTTQLLLLQGLRACMTVVRRYAVMHRLCPLSGYGQGAVNINSIPLLRTCMGLLMRAAHV